ncbi:MAG TPA: hypothetical protein DET40_18200 [Lentisphaeria bacterium]|nr:MAG: hypothetical protein A2X45_25000 [Lentisphaerae bacterium GWF2_50_93]HCE45476.1 hypothetical protein [Lentisphaeria bacterium]
MFLSELHEGKCIRTESSVKFDKSYDAVVAGLGTAGAIAALSAAENGASVLGVERINLCGGTATAGGVFSYYYGIPGGRFEDIDAKAGKLREGNFITNGVFHPDAKAIALEREILDKGASILYESSVIGAYLSAADKVCGVRLATPEGVKNIGCKILIDASGDGEVCAMAGAKYREGREFDGLPQPCSSVRVYVRDGKIHMANFDAGYALSSDAADMTRGMISSNSLHMSAPGEAAPPLLWITTMPGLREGRLIACDRTLTFADFMDGKHETDPVVWAYSNFDSHTQDWVFEDDLAKDWMVAASLWGKVFTFPVPLETMLVKDFSNLMAVGRCLSVDHIMACALRMQRCMQKLGQAAGTAAALALRANTGLRSVDRKALKKLLESDHCLDASKLPDCSYPQDPEKLKEILSSDAPGEAIWHLSRNSKDFGKLLLEWLAGSDRGLSKNAALALGIAGRRETLPFLRMILKERDNFLPKSSRGHNQPRLLGAIHLLAKLNDAESIGPLLDFIEAPDLNVQEFSHAFVSLLTLGENLPQFRKDIASRLTAVMCKDSFSYELTLKNSSQNGQRVFEPLTGMMRLAAARAFKGWAISSRLPELLDMNHLSWREQHMIRELLGS